MAERAARRTEVLDLVAAKLSTDTAVGWEARLRPLGIPAAAVRSLAEALKATPGAIVTAGDHRLIGSPVKVSGYKPVYRAAPRFDEYSSGASEATGNASGASEARGDRAEDQSS
jgi:crotonobetainyl-CoA:carnitine CoA-transferase CaiB-like acyl-CoA transferase